MNLTDFEWVGRALTALGREPDPTTVEGIASAIALARDNGLPIIVFSLDEPNGLAGIVQGRGRFTIVEPG